MFFFKVKIRSSKYRKVEYSRYSEYKLWVVVSMFVRMFRIFLFSLRE